MLLSKTSGLITARPLLLRIGSGLWLALERLVSMETCVRLAEAAVTSLSRLGLGEAFNASVDSQTPGWPSEAVYSTVGVFRGAVYWLGEGGVCYVEGLNQNVCAPRTSGTLVSSDLWSLETISWCFGPVCVPVLQLPRDWDHAYFYHGNISSFVAVLLASGRPGLC